MGISSIEKQQLINTSAKEQQIYGIKGCYKRNQAERGAKAERWDGVKAFRNKAFGPQGREDPVLPSHTPFA
ncbi:hypothetical protein ACLOJK_038468 [Asimina triloba]